MSSWCGDSPPRYVRCPSHCTAPHRTLHFTTPLYLSHRFCYCSLPPPPLLPPASCCPQNTDYQQLLSTFAEGLYTEMDFRNEALNAQRMTQLLADRCVCRVPRSGGVVGASGGRCRGTGRVGGCMQSGHE